VINEPNFGPDLPPGFPPHEAIIEGFNEALTRHSTLFEVGAHQDRMGQFIIPNAKVIFYDVGGDWEIDIITPKASIGFDVPFANVSGKFFDDNNAHARVLGGLRYLLREHGRDKLLALINEAEAEMVKNRLTTTVGRHRDRRSGEGAVDRPPGRRQPCTPQRDPWRAGSTGDKRLLAAPPHRSMPLATPYSSA
jgi:hypothetical protein